MKFNKNGGVEKIIFFLFIFLFVPEKIYGCSEVLSMKKASCYNWRSPTEIKTYLISLISPSEGYLQELSSLKTLTKHEVELKKICNKDYTSWKIITVGSEISTMSRYMAGDRDPSCGGDPNCRRLKNVAVYVCSDPKPVKSSEELASLLNSLE